MVSPDGKPLKPGVPMVMVVHPDGGMAPVPFPEFCLELMAYMGKLSFSILHQGEDHGEGTEDRGEGQSH